MGTRCVWVEAPFKELGTWETEKVQVGSTVNRVEKGIFNKKLVDQVTPVYEEKKVWKQRAISDSLIDGQKLSELINDAIQSLENEGYEVVSITPITSGKYDYDYEAPIVNAKDRASYGWGYGYSFTEGVTIFAKTTNSQD